MTLSIRRYRPEDRAACAQIFYHAVHQGAAAFYTPAQRKAWAPSPLPKSEVPDKLLTQACWLGEKAGRVVGFLSLCEDGYLDMAFVHPSVQGKGVAASLYSVLEQDARARAMPQLTTHASHLARRFFLKNGWQVEAMEHHPHHGQVFERFRMFKTLA